MSPWKCPHCGTPQAESARCWACKRSPLACSTCRDFRRSVAGRLGFCGRDRSREALTGDEVRPCWTAPHAVADALGPGLFDLASPDPEPTRSAGPPPDPEPVAARPPVVAPVHPPDAPGAPGAPHPAIAAGSSPRPAPVHAPAPCAHEAAQRRWDALVADIASGVPLGSEPMRWRHRAVDEPPPASPPEPAAPARPASLSLIPATLANRLRRHIGTRGPRADGVTPPEVLLETSRAASASLTGGSPRAVMPVGRQPLATHGRLVEAHPVPGTVITLGAQLRRAEQLRRERALLDDQRLGGDGGGDPRA